MTRETHVRFQMPDGDEYKVQLTEDQRETVDAACDYLNMELGLFVNAASKWGKTNDPDLPQRIGEEMNKRARGVSDERKAELKQRGKERVLKKRIVAFARFVVEDKPDAKWMTGNGQLRFGGELNQ